MIGKKLRELRTRRGMTRQELAKVIGVSVRSVKNWENDVSNPDLIHASAIADFFGISMDELLGRDIDGIFTIGKMREDDRKKLDAVIQAFSAACRDDEEINGLLRAKSSQQICLVRFQASVARMPEP